LGAALSWFQEGAGLDAAQPTPKPTPQFKDDSTAMLPSTAGQNQVLTGSFFALKLQTRRRGPTNSRCLNNKKAARFPEPLLTFRPASGEI